MKRFFPQAWLVAGLLAGATVCASGCRRRHPHAPVLPVAPAPTTVAVASVPPVTPVGVTVPAAVCEETIGTRTLVQPLPPRTSSLRPYDQIRWQMVDNARELVAISKQRMQREEQIRTQDQVAQGLYRAGGPQSSDYQARIRRDAKIQDLDRQSEERQQHQRTWAETCQKFEKETAKP